jgi:26S proteasome regulatory subunit N10
MPLEAVMIIADNSESSRNGDYQPTRFDAQADAINILFDSITQGNPESSVGLMSMGGKGPEVLSTLTTERGKILDGLHRTKKKISGKSHLATGIQIASVRNPPRLLKVPKSTLTSLMAMIERFIFLQ